MAVMPEGRDTEEPDAGHPLAGVVAPRPERCEYTPGIGAVAQSVRAADS